MICTNENQLKRQILRRKQGYRNVSKILKYNRKFQSEKCHEREFVFDTKGKSIRKLREEILLSLKQIGL